MNRPFYSILLFPVLLMASIHFFSEKNTQELLDGITDVTLIFTPSGGGDAITATAQDPDGSGPQSLQVVGDISLSESTEYSLSILVENAGTNLSQEILQNKNDYQFFFGWSEDVMADPNGDGNIDNSSDPVGYDDQDDNNRPIGLATSWTSGCSEGNLSGLFRIVLKHQPGLKSDTTGVTTGDTDFDLSWAVNIAEDPSAPPCENEEEIITDVTLTFTPENGGDPVVASAKDPDGEGPLDLTISGPINLDESTEYSLSVSIENKIEGENITEEIREEDEDHIFFYSWTDGLFSAPAGDGNIDNRADPVGYQDFDENNLPVGLSTQWTAGASGQSGDFRLVLKHQPDIKSETSSVADGGTDLDLEWTLNITVATSVWEQQQRNANLSLFPNPTRSQLRWEISEIGLAPVDVRIYDQTGRVLKVFTADQNIIDVSDLNAGVFTLQIVSEGKIWNKRFFKQ